jgi:hypothetical protein
MAQHSDLEVVPPAYLEVDHVKEGQTNEKRVLTGIFWRKWRWAIVLVSIIFVGALVGGIVGGLHARNSKHDPAPSR